MNFLHELPKNWFVPYYFGQQIGQAHVDRVVEVAVRKEIKLAEWIGRWAT